MHQKENGGESINKTRKSMLHTLHEKQQTTKIGIRVKEQESNIIKIIYNNTLYIIQEAIMYKNNSISERKRARRISNTTSAFCRNLARIAKIIATKL